MNYQKVTKLRNKLWIYLSIFSAVILAGLWLFQVIFLTTYYEWQKTRELDGIASQIEKGYQGNQFEQTLDNITYNNGVCIELMTADIRLYSTNSLIRGCISSDYNSELLNHRQNFIKSNQKRAKYTLFNKKFQNKTLEYALKLDDNYYAFVNVSLKPLGTTTKILASQLIYVTIGIFILAFILAYFISKKVAEPIVQINQTAKKMAKGEYQLSFDTNQSIQELKELGETLNNACCELAKTEKVRREFLANVSHDLKTPLTMIKAYAELVRDLTYDNKEKREEDLNIIIDETERLNRLVNDILELSKIQSEVEKLNYEEIHLNRLLQQMINKFSYLEQVEGYHFVFETCEDNIIIEADVIRMEQVIYNLINNAIDHVGKKKEITIKVEKEKNNYVVKIIDDGKGIDQKNLSLIWDKYYKIDKTHKRSVKGTGLGLSIVKNILEKHHFEYGVISQVKKGTTFYFKIPFKKNK